MKKIGNTTKYDDSIFQAEKDEETCEHCGNNIFISIDSCLGLICNKCLEETIKHSSLTYA